MAATAASATASTTASNLHAAGVTGMGTGGSGMGTATGSVVGGAGLGHNSAAGVIQGNGVINSHVVGTGQHGAMQGAGVGGGGTYGGVPQQLAGLLDTAQRLLAETTGAGYGQDYGKINALPPQPAVYTLMAMQAEVRTLDFWRSIFAECVATFFYVMMATSVSVTTSGKNDSYSGDAESALAAGMAAAVLTLAFARVSGAHMNPAVTLAVTLIRQVSPLRAVLYMCAQCGGAIAGTALVKGIEGKALTDAALNQRKGAFGLEFVLTFLIVYAYCASRVDYAARTGSAHQPPPGSSLYGTTAGHQGHYGTSGTLGAPTGLFGSGGGIFGGGYRSTATNATSTYNSANYASSAVINPFDSARPDPLIIGVAYGACLLAYRGCLNPARALGAAFVFKEDNPQSDTFNQHWVFWVGPLLGGVTGGFAFEYIFSSRRRPLAWETSMSGTTGFGTALTSMSTGGGLGGGFGGLNAANATGNTGATTGFQAANMMGNNIGGGLGNNMGTMGGGHGYDITDMTHPDDLAMMDDLERAKHYKSNIIQDFNDRQSMYSSRVGVGFGGPNAYNKSRYDDGLYSESKSMYGGYGGGGDGTGKMYGHDGGGGSKSVYAGYSASNAGSNPVNNLRRSRSIHAKLPPRRDPYDYLPDEPQTQLLNEQNAAAGVGAGNTGTGTGAMVGNKPDIMQSVGMDGAGRPGLKGGPANSSPANRYGTTGPGGPGGPGGPSSHSPKIYTNDLNAYGTATGPAGAGADPYGYRDGPDMYNDGRGPRSRGLHPSEGDYGTGRGGAGAGGRLSRMREAGPGGGGYGNPTGTGPPSAQGYNTTYNAQPAPMAM